MFGKRHIKGLPVPDGSDDWYVIRTIGLPNHPGGIGGSEVSVVMGVNQYQGKHELFFVKIGAHTKPRINNPRLQRGKDIEPLLREYWKFYRGDDTWVEDYTDFVKNHKPSLNPWEYKKFYYRDNRLVKYPIYNEKIPFLLMNLDFVLPRGHKKFLSEDTAKMDCPIEAKTMSYLIERKYETGIPPMYYLQIQAQMMVMEADYGEIVLWIDGDIKLYPVFANKEIQDILFERCNEFWNKVLRGRELMDLLKVQDYGSKTYEEISAEIQYISPPVDAISAEEDFIKETWKKEQESIACEPRLNDDFYMYNFLKTVEGIVKKEMQQKHKNNMLEYLKTNNVAQAIINDTERFTLQERNYGGKMVPTLSMKGAKKLTIDEKKELTRKIEGLFNEFKGVTN